MKYKIEFDRDYGIEKRTGWSIAVDGHYIVQLEKHLFIALTKAVGLNHWLARHLYFIIIFIMVFALVGLHTLYHFYNFLLTFICGMIAQVLLEKYKKTKVGLTGL